MSLPLLFDDAVHYPRWLSLSAAPPGDPAPQTPADCRLQLILGAPGPRVQPESLLSRRRLLLPLSTAPTLGHRQAWLWIPDEIQSAVSCQKHPWP